MNDHTPNQTMTFFADAARQSGSLKDAARAFIGARRGAEIPGAIGILASTEPGSYAEGWSSTKSHDPIDQLKTVALSVGMTDQSQKLRDAALRRALTEGKADVRDAFNELCRPSYAVHATNPTYRQALADFGAAALVRERAELSRSNSARNDEGATR